MNKNFLSYVALLGSVFATAQVVTPESEVSEILNVHSAGMSFHSAFDKFLSLEDFSTVTNYNAWDNELDVPSDESAYKGLYWSDQDGVGVVSSKDRDACASNLSYTISQDQGKYEAFELSFGSFANEDGDKEDFTLDLSSQSVVNFNVTNLGVKTIRFSVELEDVNGVLLRYLEDAEFDEDAAYNYYIGFVQGETDALVAGNTSEFDYDFEDALEGCDALSIQGDPIVATESDTDDCEESFDYSQVRSVKFIVVDDAHTGNVSGTHDDKATDYLPLALVDYPISISNFSIGDVMIESLGYTLVYADECVGLEDAEISASYTIYPNPSSNEVNFSEYVTNVVVYDLIGNVVLESAGTKKLDISSYNVGVYTVSTDQGITKLIIE